VWCGVVWCGVVWCGVVWCGVVWCGVVWFGVVWCGVGKKVPAIGMSWEKMLTPARMSTSTRETAQKTTSVSFLMAEDMSFRSRRE